MNQEKIGKFIAECRKEKNLTQLQLVEPAACEKIGVCNPAVLLRIIQVPLSVSSTFFLFCMSQNPSYITPPQQLHTFPASYRPQSGSP